MTTSGNVWRRSLSRAVRSAWVVAGLASLAAAAPATQTPAASPGTAVPRTRDGKPDLSGIWQALNTAEWDVQPHQAREGVPAGLGVVEGDDIPYQPWAAAKKQENFERRATADAETKCYLPGVPRLMYMPYPYQIVQTPDQVTMLFEYVHAIRYIYTNGTPHPSGHLDWWLGIPGDAGKTIRWSWTPSTSTIRRGSTERETSTASSCTPWNASA